MASETPTKKQSLFEDGTDYVVEKNQNLNIIGSGLKTRNKDESSIPLQSAVFGFVKENFIVPIHSTESKEKSTNNKKNEKEFTSQKSIIKVKNQGLIKKLGKALNDIRNKLIKHKEIKELPIESNKKKVSNAIDSAPNSVARKLFTSGEVLPIIPEVNSDQYLKSKIYTNNNSNGKNNNDLANILIVKGLLPNSNKAESRRI